MEQAAVYLFPGQGSQVEGMATWATDHAPDLYALAKELVGEDPFPLVEASTRYAQPAILVASLARWRAAGRPPAVGFAGHSLGELSALAAAGALSEEEAVALAVARGAAMAQASEGEREQGLLAVIGEGVEAVQALCKERSLYPANENSPKQLVVGGYRDQLQGLKEEVEGRGFRAVELKVRGAYHTPLLAAAVPEFEAALAKVTFKAPQQPVVSGLSGLPFSNPAAELAQALVTPVRFGAALAKLWELGGRTFIDVGPGRVLVRLVRENLPEAEAKALPLPAAVGGEGGRP
jgi:[acyl-carrier-protein] S-malonyltransferase